MSQNFESDLLFWDRDWCLRKCTYKQLSPGDRIVSFLIGQFSLLWIDQQKRLNFNVDVVESEWGQGANLEILASKLAADTARTIKAICIVHNETATGVTNNLATVRSEEEGHIIWAEASIVGPIFLMQSLFWLDIIDLIPLLLNRYIPNKSMKSRKAGHCKIFLSSTQKRYNHPKLYHRQSFNFTMADYFLKDQNQF